MWCVSGTSTFLLQHPPAQHSRHEHAQVSDFFSFGYVADTELFQNQFRALKHSQNSLSWAVTIFGCFAGKWSRQKAAVSWNRFQQQIQEILKTWTLNKDVKPQDHLMRFVLFLCAGWTSFCSTWRRPASGSVGLTLTRRGFGLTRHWCSLNLSSPSTVSLHALPPPLRRASAQRKVCEKQRWAHFTL